MYVVQRTNLSPTWHMFLMALMSLVLFLGGLFAPNDRLPVDFISEAIPNEGLLRPTMLSSDDETKLTEGLRLYYRQKDLRELPQRLKQPVPRAVHAWIVPALAAFSVPPEPERILPLHQKAHLPYPGWDGPIRFALPPPLTI